MMQPTAQEILKRRARELARPLIGAAGGQSLQVLEFRLAQERYALEQQYVREVLSLHDLTVLPCVPDFIAGLINVRGQILPVINIKRFFELPETGITDLHMVIVLHAGEMELGLLADAITGMRRIPLDMLQPTMATLTGIRAQYLKGVAKGHVVVLDAIKILGDPKLLVEQESETQGRS